MRTMMNELSTELKSLLKDIGFNQFDRLGENAEVWLHLLKDEYTSFDAAQKALSMLGGLRIDKRRPTGVNVAPSTFENKSHPFSR